MQIEDEGPHDFLLEWKDRTLSEQYNVSRKDIMISIPEIILTKIEMVDDLQEMFFNSLKSDEASIFWIGSFHLKNDIYVKLQDFQLGTDYLNELGGLCEYMHLQNRVLIHSFFINIAESNEKELYMMLFMADKAIEEMIMSQNENWTLAISNIIVATILEEQTTEKELAVEIFYRILEYND